ncbi:hypothetical protein KKG41_02205 [Patescibacteria group bacterium]|nr:hypothetical protein [Patescibacteria group bacterium]MBU1889917.1 hypothetical protein [Patescibacteria group bacterium]
MGTIIETNDTLQITREQGFPKELDYDRYQKYPFTSKDFKGRVFEFHDKPKIRIYHAPPVRNFLAENRDGKWIYWGQVHIIEVTHDMVKQTTSGKFKIEYIYTPDEMKQAHNILDRRPDVSVK